MGVTPTAAVEILLGLPLVHLYVESKASWATWRLNNAAVNFQLVYTMRITKFLRDIKNDTMLERPSDIMKTTHNYNLPCSIIFPRIEDCDQIQVELLSPEINYFTNGAKTDEGVGIQKFPDRLAVLKAMQPKNGL